MPLFVVDTIVQFRHKYIVEADKLEHAYDEVVMRDSKCDDDFFDEATQRYLGETILDGREITMEQFHQMLKDWSEDKAECSSHWCGEKLIRKINYER